MGCWEASSNRAEERGTTVSRWGGCNGPWTSGRKDRDAEETRGLERERDAVEGKAAVKAKTNTGAKVPVSHVVL